MNPQQKPDPHVLPSPNSYQEFVINMEEYLGTNGFKVVNESGKIKVINSAGWTLSEGANHQNVVLKLALEALIRRST